MNSTHINRPTEHDVDVVVNIISNSMLYYTLEDGELEPNGKLFEEKIDCPEEWNKYHNQES